MINIKEFLLIWVGGGFRYNFHGSNRIFAIQIENIVIYSTPAVTDKTESAFSFDDLQT